MRLVLVFLIAISMAGLGFWAGIDVQRARSASDFDEIGSALASCAVELLVCLHPEESL